MKAEFLSDNSAGVHPRVLARLAEVNEGYAPAYGDDALSKALEIRLGEIFEHEVSVWMLGTGTAANCLLLSALTPPYGAIFCHEECHLLVDESSAPALFTSGARLVGIGGEGALIDAQALDERLRHWPRGDVHSVQAACIALTQSSELGRVYRSAHLDEIAAVAQDHELPIFMDGARFANALVSTGATPAELTWKQGVRALTFGTTKNGTLSAEAAVVFDRDLALTLPFLHKRAGQLASKMRYFAAQILALVEDDLWLDNARHANTMGARLAAALEAGGHATLAHRVDANEIFAVLNEGARHRLNDAGYVLNEVPSSGINTTRFVTSWATQPEDIETLLKVLE